MPDMPSVKTYGLESLLSNKDDAQLWEAALAACWPKVDDPTLMVDTLRFLLGRSLDSGELPQGDEAIEKFNKFGMVDMQEWGFERLDASQLRVTAAPTDDAPASPLRPGFGMPGISSGLMNFQAAATPARIVMYLGISRSSRDADQVVVFCGSSMPGAAEGKAEVWKRTVEQGWQATGEIITRWLT